MPEPRLRLRIETEADAAVSATQRAAQSIERVTNLTKLDAVAAKLNEEAQKKSGQETDNLTAKKSKLLDAFKKLTHEVPIVGAAINAIKNPLSAATIAFGIAAAAVKRFVEEINQIANLQAAEEALGRIKQSFVDIEQKSKNAQRAFEESLEAIRGKAETAADYLGRMNDQIERTARLKEQVAEKQKQEQLEAIQFAEGAGLISKEEADLRRSGVEKRFGASQRLRQNDVEVAKIEALFNARNRAQDQAIAAKQALPAAQSDLDAASMALAVEQKKQAREQPVDQALQAQLQTKLGTISGGIVDIETELGQGGLAPLAEAYRRGRLRELQAEQQGILDQLEGIETRGAQRSAIITQLTGNFESRQRRVQMLQGQITTGTQATIDYQRSIGAQAQASAAERAIFPLPQGQFFQDPRTQQRFDEQAAALQRGFVHGGAVEVGNAVKRVFTQFIKELLGEIKKLEARSARDIQNEQ